jgi:hypothetical protein
MLSLAAGKPRTENKYYITTINHLLSITTTLLLRITITTLLSVTSTQQLSDNNCASWHNNVAGIQHSKPEDLNPPCVNTVKTSNLAKYCIYPAKT